MAPLSAAIMQPYFFPYLGYFQLMAAVDVFVVHDDAQFIKGGWVNRNRILGADGPRWIVLPLEADNHTLGINRRRVVPGRTAFSKIVRQVEAAYRRAPYFDAVFPIVQAILSFDEHNLAAFNLNLLRTVAGRLGISSHILVSSELHKDDTLRGEERVIEICLNLGADRYINPIGGLELYQRPAFAARGIELALLRSTPRAYAQFRAAPVSGLSILDVMMFNDDSAIRTMLREFELIEPAGLKSGGPHNA
jgi:hypothetical protein